VSAQNEDRLAQFAVRVVCRRRLPHIHFATHFLKSPKREGIRALAAFVTIAHDALAPTAAGETCCSSSDVAPLLGEQIARIYSNALELPNSEFRDPSQHVLHAFRCAAQSFEIPQQHLINWLDATVASRSVLRYATWSSLEQRIHQASGSLALAAAAILGVTRSDATPLILNCATAIDLITILARVSTDRAAGRISIPVADLAQHRYSERRLLAGEPSDNFANLIRALGSRACALLNDGRALIPWLAGDGSRAATAALLVQYTRLLDRIDRNPTELLSQVLTPRPSLRDIPAIYRIARQPPAAITPSSPPSSAATLP
jgi:phytoene/squalene synthetase